MIRIEKDKKVGNCNFQKVQRLFVKFAGVRVSAVLAAHRKASDGSGED